MILSLILAILIINRAESKPLLDPGFLPYITNKRIDRGLASSQDQMNCEKEMSIMSYAKCMKNLFGKYAMHVAAKGSLI